MSILRNPKAIGRRILFAEDHQPTRDVLALLLRNGRVRRGHCAKRGGCISPFSGKPFSVRCGNHRPPKCRNSMAWVW
jgi:hypothetical protein